jgi:hypothetical protein
MPRSLVFVGVQKALVPLTVHWLQGEQAMPHPVQLAVLGVMHVPLQHRLGGLQAPQVAAQVALVEQYGVPPSTAQQVEEPVHAAPPPHWHRLPLQVLPLVQLAGVQVGVPHTCDDGTQPCPRQHCVPIAQSGPASQWHADSEQLSLALHTVVQLPQCLASVARLAHSAEVVPPPQQVSVAGLHMNGAGTRPHWHLPPPHFSPLAHA